MAGQAKMTVRMQPASAADSMHMYICEQAEHIECGFVVCLHGGCYTSGGLRRSWASVIDQLRFGLCLLVWIVFRSSQCQYIVSALLVSALLRSDCSSCESDRVKQQYSFDLCRNPHGFCTAKPVPRG